VSPSHDDLAKNNREQLEEALGPDNRWFAGLCLGHCPSDDEAVWYYISHGGAEGHRKRMEAKQHMPPDQPPKES